MSKALIALAKHKVIGVDFDGTLTPWLPYESDGTLNVAKINDAMLKESHARAVRLHDFILDNHLEKHFHIITFRNGGWEKEIWRDLHIESRGRLSSIHFSSLNPMPSAGSGSHKRVDLARAKGHHHLITEADLFHYHWKGWMCKQLGATAMIDDIDWHVKPGCEVHGIEFVHALDL